MTQVDRRTVIVDGMITSFLEAGTGESTRSAPRRRVRRERRTRVGAQYRRARGALSRDRP